MTLKSAPKCLPLEEVTINIVFGTILRKLPLSMVSCPGTGTKGICGSSCISNVSGSLLSQISTADYLAALTSL